MFDKYSFNTFFTSRHKSTGQLLSHSAHVLPSSVYIDVLYCPDPAAYSPLKLLSEVGVEQLQLMILGQMS